MITSYQFGSITIDGQTYDHDIEVDWEGKIEKWWRNESHVIDAESVARALEKEPEVVVIGTGQSGVAKVMDDAVSAIESRGIELVAEVTGDAG